MGGPASNKNSISVQTGGIIGSAVAVGPHARSKVLAQRSELSHAQTDELTGLLDRLIEGLGHETDSEVRADALAVRAEIHRKKVNLSLVRPALKGIAASLASVQSLSDIATNVLSLVRHIG